MMILYFVLTFIAGSFVSMSLYAFMIARDKNLVHLQEDEVVIKRPLPQFVLVQVTPDVARRLVNTGGEVDLPNKAEARALYPERSMGEQQKRLDINE